MGLYLQGNTASLSALNSLTRNTNLLNQSLERLATGYKINRASDGAAQLALSNALQAQIRGSQAAKTNVTAGLSVLGTAEVGVQNITESLQDIRELAVAAASGTVTDFTAYNADFQAAVGTINAAASNTEFNGQNLLNGSITNYTLQIGPNGGDTLNIASAFSTNASAASLGISLGAITSTGDATALIAQVDTALANIGNIEARIGGFTNSLENQSAYLDVAITNYTASDLSIRGTDVATETANVARYQILQEASIAALTQANSRSNITLLLLGIQSK